MKKIRRCVICGNYSLEIIHCGKQTVSAHPPPFNPNDLYSHYRRMWKKHGVIHEKNNNN